jgi:Right handed beta helix region
MILFIVGLALQASAADCGGGGTTGFPKVPCNCGDTVTVSTALTGADPVVYPDNIAGPNDGYCPSNGLTVNAGVTLNLNGMTIAGSDNGTGLMIAGNNVRIQTGGLGGSIKGFQDGVSGTTSNSQFRSFSVSENKGKGFGIASNGIGITSDLNTISGILAFDNGGNGITVEGHRNTISANQAFSNIGNGIEVKGDNNTIDSNGVGEQGEGNTGIGIRVEGSAVPVLVPANRGFNNLISNNDVFDNDADGIVVVGGANSIAGNSVGEVGKGNGEDGIRVQGDRNVIGATNVVFANGMNGIVVEGGGNTIQKNTVGDRTRGNGGAGIQVIGATNRLTENKVFANIGDGINVSGGIATAGPNVLLKNAVGERGKGNGGNGIFIDNDVGNGTPDPVELDSNIVRSNALDGILIGTLATGHELRKNSSGGSGDQANGGCAFNNKGANNLNATGNTANNRNITGADGSLFPADCLN